MVKGYRSTRWEFPGGKREKNETATDCIRREVMEEIGVDIKEKISED